MPPGELSIRGNTLSGASYWYLGKDKGTIAELYATDGRRRGAEQYDPDVLQINYVSTERCPDQIAAARFMLATAVGAAVKENPQVMAIKIKISSNVVDGKIVGNHFHFENAVLIRQAAEFAQRLAEHPYEIYERWEYSALRDLGFSKIDASESGINDAGDNKGYYYLFLTRGSSAMDRPS